MDSSDSLYMYLMKREGIENVVFTGIVDGKRGRGMPRETHVDGLVKLIGSAMAHAQLIRTTHDREHQKCMVDDVMEDMAQRQR